MKVQKNFSDERIVNAIAILEYYDESDCSGKARLDNGIALHFKNVADLKVMNISKGDKIAVTFLPNFRGSYSIEKILKILK